MKWFGPETFVEKLRRLEQEVAKYDRVILVGESAGASMALHMSKKNPKNVIRYVTLCGVCQAAMPIGARLQKRSPALVKATRTLTGNYPLEKLHHYMAWKDFVIGEKHSSVPGAKTTTLFSIGHFFTIALCLTLYAPWFARSIQKN